MNIPLTPLPRVRCAHGMRFRHTIPVPVNTVRDLPWCYPYPCRSLFEPMTVTNITYAPFFQLSHQTIYSLSTITTPCMTMLPHVCRTPIMVPGWLRLSQLLRTRGELGKECIMI